MQLSLLISDNVLEDSTNVALKRYAKADFLAFQNKDHAAIDSLSVVLENHKGSAVEDEALLKQAQLYEKQGNFAAAAENYERIIYFFGDGILADDSFYALGLLYELHLDDKERAMRNYEQLIFNHQDSIFFFQPQGTGFGDSEEIRLIRF